MRNIEETKRRRGETLKFSYGLLNRAVVVARSTVTFSRAFQMNREFDGRT